MLQKFFAKMQNEDGQGIIEYSLMAALIAIAAIAAVQVVGVNVNTIFTNVGNTLGAAPL